MKGEKSTKGQKPWTILEVNILAIIQLQCSQW